MKYSQIMPSSEMTKCFICLNKFQTQPLGTPESCDHTFCLNCLQTWSQRVNTCPLDRRVFNQILARRARSKRIYRKIAIDDTSVGNADVEDLTYCRVCLRPDREHRMLLCDGCDNGYHCECLTPPIVDIPAHEWFCPVCVESRTAQRMLRCVPIYTGICFCRRLIQAGSYVLVNNFTRHRSTHTNLLNHLRVAKVVNVTRSKLEVKYMMRPNNRKPHRWMWPLAPAATRKISTRDVVPLNYPNVKPNWPRPIYEFAEIFNMS